MTQHIERGWRVLATGFCFVVFGIGGVLLRCIYPIFALVVRRPESRARLMRSVIRWCFQHFVSLMSSLGVLTYEVRNPDRLNRDGMLVLANHPTLIDVVFLIALIPNADCIVKAALFNNPFTRGPVCGAGFIANNTAEQLVDDCIASLRAGNNLIIFPEGTRTPIHGPVRLQRGAANVAIRGGVDVTPVRIQSSQPLLTKGQPWWHVPARRPHLIIDVGLDIPISDYDHFAGKDAVAVRQLTEDLMEQLLGDRFRAAA